MKLVVVIVGLVIAASMAWFAAEQHYENCVAAAKAAYPEDAAPTRQDLNDWGPDDPLGEAEARFLA